MFKAKETKIFISMSKVREILILKKKKIIINPLKFCNMQKYSVNSGF